jgi:hypothetical protein
VQVPLRQFSLLSIKTEKMKIIITLVFIVLGANLSSAQVKTKVSLDNVEMTNLKALEYSTQMRIEFGILINSKITKYDRIHYCLVRKKKTESVYESCYSRTAIGGWTLNTKTFKDKYSGKSTIDFTLWHHEITEARSYFEDYEYRIEVYGFFENGTETVKRNGSYKTVPTYEYSKIAVVSEAFSFVRDEVYHAAEKEKYDVFIKKGDEYFANKEWEKARGEYYDALEIIKNDTYAVAQRKLIEEYIAEEKVAKDLKREQEYAASVVRQELITKSKENFATIENEYTKYITVPGTGKRVQPKIQIFNTYKMMRTDLMEKDNGMDTVIKVEDKLIQLKGSNTNKLRKALKGKTATDEIVQIILEFEK